MRAYSYCLRWIYFIFFSLVGLRCVSSYCQNSSPTTNDDVHETFTINDDDDDEINSSFVDCLNCLRYFILNKK